MYKNEDIKFFEKIKGLFVLIKNIFSEKISFAYKKAYINNGHLCHLYIFWLKNNIRCHGNTEK